MKKFERPGQNLLLCPFFFIIKSNETTITGTLNFILIVTINLPI